MFDAEFVCSVFFLTGIFPLVNDQLCILNLEIILEKKKKHVFKTFHGPIFRSTRTTYTQVLAL